MNRLSGGTSVREHNKKSRIRIEDTGLGIERTNKVALLQITTRPRSVEEKRAFYRLLCAELLKDCDIAYNDVMVSFVENTDVDLSFGHGEAQFLTGALRIHSAPYLWDTFLTGA